MSEHELRSGNDPRLYLEADGEICCSGCGFHCLQWHEQRSSSRDQSVLIRTRCEGCTRVADLHIVWYKGSILTRWYVVAERSDFEAPAPPMQWPPARA